MIMLHEFDSNPEHTFNPLSLFSQFSLNNFCVLQHKTGYDRAPDKSLDLGNLKLNSQLRNLLYGLL